MSLPCQAPCGRIAGGKKKPRIRGPGRACEVAVMCSDTRKNKLDPAEGTRLSATDLQKFSPKNKVEVVLAVQYARLRANAPDPAKHPIFRPLWEGFVLRIESYLETPQENRSLEK